jgi:hypothetical protein
LLDVYYVEECTVFVFVFYVSIDRQLSQQNIDRTRKYSSKSIHLGYTDQANGHTWANDMPKLILLCCIHGPVTV